MKPVQLPVWRQYDPKINKKKLPVTIIFFRAEMKILILFCSQGPVHCSWDFYFLYNIWQDVGIWTRVAATAARCATYELHTSLNILVSGAGSAWCRYRNNSISKLYYQRTCIIVDIPTSDVRRRPKKLRLRNAGCNRLKCNLITVYCVGGLPPAAGDLLPPGAMSSYSSLLSYQGLSGTLAELIDSLNDWFLVQSSCLVAFPYHN